MAARKWYREGKLEKRREVGGWGSSRGKFSCGDQDLYPLPPQHSHLATHQLQGQCGTRNPGVLLFFVVFVPSLAKGTPWVLTAGDQALP